MNVRLENGKFFIGGEETQIISGALHYFRIPKPLWRDRLMRCQAAGLNAIETYFAWNLHEEREGEFKQDGILDFVEFINIAKELGLFVICRPGPYICAEHDNGGLPGWLMVKKDVKIRVMNQVFLQAVEKYFDWLLPQLAKLEYPAGPVIIMQIENEYGSFGEDKEYLEEVKKLMLKNHVKSILVTADGNMDHYIQGGQMPNVPITLTFGRHGVDAFKLARKYQPNGPDFCMEFWHGWFDHWSEEHRTRNAQEAAKEVDEMLGFGGSVNLYMMHGGTNWGFNNGANWIERKSDCYAPTVTSYDYDAPISECGDLTEKYFEFQKVTSKYNRNAKIYKLDNPQKFAPVPVKLTGSTELLANLELLSEVITSDYPLKMEECNEQFGFIHYKTILRGPLNDISIQLVNLRDRAQLYLNKKYIGTLYRNDDEMVIRHLDIPCDNAELEVLVENMGRINYGTHLGLDTKGVDQVAVVLQFQKHFENRAIGLKDLSKLKFGSFANIENHPTFHHGEFELAEVADTFIEFPGIKGVVWVNGVNLGRYWDIGPTQTLYLPGCYLKQGKNEIIVLELHKLYGHEVKFLDYPVLHKK